MNRIFISAFTLWMITSMGCQRTIDEFVQEEITLPDAQWVQQADSTSDAARMFVAMQPHIHSADIEYDGEIITRTEVTDDLEIEIPPRAFEISGTLISRATIKIEIIILLKKGEWIRAHKTTAASNGRLLESHGIILARAWRGSAPITIRPDVFIKFRYRYAGADNDMKYYIPGQNDVFSPPYHFTWMPGEMGRVSVVEIPQSNTGNLVKVGYMVESKKLGWMSVAKPAKVPERNAIVTVGLPTGFQNRNTNVYLVFKKHMSLFALQSDANNRVWFRRLVPVETPFMVVTLTRFDGRYFLGTARTTDDGIADNKHFDVRPREVKLEELLKFLNNL